MAFNLAQYNLTAFNSGSENGIWINAVFQEKVTTSIGTNMEVYVAAVGNEKVNLYQAKIGNGVYLLPASGTETINEGVTIGMMSIVLGEIVGREFVDCRNTIMLESYPKVNGAEIVEASLSLGGNVYLKSTLSEIISAEVITDKETYLVASGYELVSSSATLESVDIKVCEINITLQPGQKLVVDAINYNVLLDNENVIWAQSGDWIDEITRETSSISVTASAGVANLSASILYTERYL